jgi:hypothetical protein
VHVPGALRAEVRMIGVVLLLVVALLVLETELERQRSAKRLAELYRRDSDGRWE